VKSTGPSLAVRQLVIERSDWGCLRCRQARGAQIHHRRPRKSGGTSRPEINSPENLAFLCLNCHIWVEHNREAAKATGWLVPEGVDGPLEVPLMDLRGNRFFLTEEGEIRYLPTVAGLYPTDPEDWVTPWSAAS
jgi:hypothetical protein